MNNPIVLSVCIPSYNRKDLLKKNIEELLKYDGNDLEVVVVDNASEDGSWEYLQSIKDRRVKIFRNPENRGAGYNCSRAIINCSGSFVLNLNDRDMIMHKDLEEYIRFLRGCTKDVIITGRQAAVVKVDMTSFKNRAFALLRASHPGMKTYSKRIIDQYRIFWEDEIEKTPERWDYGSKKLAALCVSSTDWVVYGRTQLVVFPDNIENIKQERIVAGVRCFFTPEARAKKATHWMCNEHIEKNYFLENCKGIYLSFAAVLLSSYRSEIKRYRRGQIRYLDFTPPKRVSYLQVMNSYYQGVKRGMIQWGYYPLTLRIYMFRVSIKEYFRFVLKVLTYKGCTIGERVAKIAFRKKSA